MSEWKCSVTYDFMTQLCEVVWYRHTPAGMEHVEIVGGTTMVKQTMPGVVVDRTAVPHLRQEMIDALVAAVNPGPSAAEMARVQEALDIERRRVDAILAGRIEPT